MSTTKSTFDPTEEKTTDHTRTLATRDVRALTEEMTVLEHIGQVRGADDLYLVVSQSGKEYLVDTREGACECPDFEYNLPTDDGRHTCKHLAAVTYTVGLRPIPGWVDRDAICDQLLAADHVDGSPRFTPTDDTADRPVATDGGFEPETDVSDDCAACAELEELPCFECFAAAREAEEAETARAEIEAEAELQRRAERALERGRWGAGGGRR